MHEQEFLDAQAKVERLYKRMGNETVRKVYAYYKQATTSQWGTFQEGGQVQSDSEIG